MNIIKRKQAKSLGLKRYFTGEPCKHGHVSERLVVNGGCCECGRIKCRKYKMNNKETIKDVRRIYLDNNKEKVAETDRKYRRENKNRLNARRRELYSNDKERYRKESVEWYAKNAERLRESRREYYRLYMQERRKSPEFKMKMAMRSMVRRLFDKTKANKNSRTEELVGYSHYELKSHIESLFIEGMSWDNRNEWHVDHIKSIHQHLIEGVTCPKIINALSNLQPLWAVDNLSKGA